MFFKALSCEIEIAIEIEKEREEVTTPNGR
jgi:hypothetical protein